MALESAGADLEGPGLEPEEVASNWSYGGTDGLYFYPEAVRWIAGDAMWTNVYDMVMTKSFYEPLFHLIATGIAKKGRRTAVYRREAPPGAIASGSRSNRDPVMQSVTPSLDPPTAGHDST